MLIATAIIAVIIIDSSLIDPLIQSNEINELININSILKENILILNKIYNYPTNLVTLLLINYLLITLIAIVKITNIFYGPIRQIN